MKKTIFLIYLRIALSLLVWVSVTVPPTAQGLIIPNVPDQQQPIPGSISNPTTNACAPVSASNIIEYYESIIKHSNAVGLVPGITASNVADYLYFFMDTGNWGTRPRSNGTSLPATTGTYTGDIQPGFYEYVRWDIQFLFGTFPPPPPSPPSPPPTLLAGKIGYTWTFTTDYNQGWPLHVFEINNLRPNVLTFSHWNPINTGFSWTDPQSGEIIDFYTWGPFVPSGGGEDWNNQEGDAAMGHAVTGVGYLLNFTPDPFSILPQDWFICHDNWTTTTRNVALPWAYWKATITADPGPDIPLAIDLMSFTATTQNGNALLNWETATELNSLCFNVERQTDPVKGFEKVATIPAQGISTTPTKYQYSEDLAFGENIYYRICQINTDAREKYSAIRAVHGLNNTAEWTIFPNPVAGYLNVLTSKKADGIILLEIHSQNGIIVSSQNTHLNPGQSLIRLDDISSLSPGIYYLRINDRRSCEVKKFLKID